MIKAIIFDKDGTLFDFNATWGAWMHAMLLAEVGDDPQLRADLADALGYDQQARVFRPGSIVIAATARDVAMTVQRILPDRDTDALLARMNAQAAAVEQVAAVDLPPLFDRLRAMDLQLGIATNDAEGPARRHLQRAGIAHHFTFVAGYDSGFGGKPAPGQLLGFCDRTGVAAKHCVMVGDSTHDLLAAKAAGMPALGVLTGPALRAELTPYADAVLQDIGMIPDWLRAQKWVSP